MANMIPSSGPKANDSHTAEPAIYQALSRQLPDDFTVIHSLPWLARAVQEITGKPAITGEIDFLILHPELGILAIEVKGGKLRYDEGQFVYPNGDRIDPIAQVTRGTFALSRWIKGAGGPALRLGYAIAFPESSMQQRILPPALVDMTSGTSENLCIDRPSMLCIRQRIEDIMRYWLEAGVTWSLRKEQITQIIRLLCPVQDYSLTWKERLHEDKQRWLLWTPEQARRLQQLLLQPRSVLTGRSGTGKTVLAMAYARAMAQQGKQVLFLVYNVQLVNLVGKECIHKNITVMNFHQLCRDAAGLTKSFVDFNGEEWYKKEAPEVLRKAIVQGSLPIYDVLVIDEAQVFHEDWIRDLLSWFRHKPALVCCDETQVFAYEYSTKASRIAELLSIPEPFTLTINLRSPYPVFERLRTHQPSSYDQYSPRPQEDDALIEKVGMDIQRLLNDTIRELHEQGIPSTSIMVIYFRVSPMYDPGVESMIGQSNSIYRCRGLEAPVVIVWADREQEDNVLLCAYSRATSRCIVIHHPCHFVGNLSPLYMQILQDNLAIQQAVKTIWPPDFGDKIVSPHLSWSRHWRGYVLHSFDIPLEAFLWMSHYAMMTTATLYICDSWLSSQQKLSLQSYRMDCGVLKHEMSEEIAWCPLCGRWTKQKRGCEECFKADEPANIPSSVLHAFPSEDEIETMYLYILSQWKALDWTQKVRLNARVGSTDNLHALVKILIGLRLLYMQEGEIIRSESISRFMKLYSWIGSSNCDDAELHRSIMSALAAWMNAKWITRLEKGVFEMRPLPALSEVEQRWLDKIRKRWEF